MSDLLRLAMIMPFLLNLFLKESSIKRNETVIIQQRIDAFRIFVNFVNLLNIHVNMHLLMHAKTFGTLINTQVDIKEMVYRIFKGMVSKTNCKNIDLDLLKYYNTLFAIRYLADGGIDPRFNRSCIHWLE
ncbi:hypothetical protein C1646_764539 [Rhizophagus diaphanus]|nr:hypothetical protein C1646_764539 [Rhizophagus diaphanus] [Rhizophagus sp. MUCL 43196]